MLKTEPNSFIELKLIIKQIELKMSKNELFCINIHNTNSFLLVSKRKFEPKWLL